MQITWLISFLVISLRHDAIYNTLCNLMTYTHQNSVSAESNYIHAFTLKSHSVKLTLVANKVMINLWTNSIRNYIAYRIILTSFFTSLHTLHNFYIFLVLHEGAILTFLKFGCYEPKNFNKNKGLRQTRTTRIKRYSQIFRMIKRRYLYQILLKA